MTGWTEQDARELQAIRIALRDIADALMDAASSCGERDEPSESGAVEDTA